MYRFRSWYWFWNCFLSIFFRYFNKSINKNFLDTLTYRVFVCGVARKNMWGNTYPLNYPSLEVWLGADIWLSEWSWLCWRLCCCWMSDWILEGLVFEGMLVSTRLGLLARGRFVLEGSACGLSCELLVLFEV